MGSILFGVLSSLLSSYITRLATQEFAQWCLFEILDAAVNAAKRHAQPGSTWDDEFAAIVAKLKSELSPAVPPAAE